MLTLRARKAHLLKKVGASPQARPKQTLMCVESALDIDVATLGEQGMKIEGMYWSNMCPMFARDSIFNRLERTRTDPNLEDGYDSKYERSAGSRESIDLATRLNARRARPEQPAPYPSNA